LPVALRYAGAAVMNVCNITGAQTGCTDILSDATTGEMVPTNVGGITCPGNANCAVKKWYDQNASGVCGGSCDLVEGFTSGSGSGNLLVANCNSSGKPCVRVVGGTNYFKSAGNLASQSQPFAFSYSVYLISSATSRFLDDGSSNCAETSFGALNFVRSNCGGSNNDLSPVNGGAFHELVLYYNGASSVGYVEGTGTNMASVGTNAFGGNSQPLGVGDFTSVTMDFFQAVTWTTSPTGTNATNLCKLNNTHFNMGLTCH